ncbi:hypothetical protein ISS05_01555 [Candidatus Woesearchaeota archaeon]|nr:hypothetical protein [Candidatus Woesearchaeota archaeon]
MCKGCFGKCFISAIATWGFFALLLRLLNAANPWVNAIWLTLLVSLAMVCCPLMGKNLSECCTFKPKKKK